MFHDCQPDGREAVLCGIRREGSLFCKPPLSSSGRALSGLPGWRTCCRSSSASRQPENSPLPGLRLKSTGQSSTIPTRSFIFNVLSLARVCLLRTASCLPISRNRVPDQIFARSVSKRGTEVSCTVNLRLNTEEASKRSSTPPQNGSLIFPGNFRLSPVPSDRPVPPTLQPAGPLAVTRTPNHIR